ncbi:MAG: N-acetylmuramoyl-L-alanine amidase [Paludibacteraceae bacterium]|nr:N-acetylmuramoyl-L-alanine amidase [Paludibacteraceae bacterium]
MTKRIIIHATNTPSNSPLSLQDIERLNSTQLLSDPMPYHYVINIDGEILKGRHDHEPCAHCGRFSRNSISVAYVGGLLPNTNEPHDTLNDCQAASLRILLRNLSIRHPMARITGANSLLHPDYDPSISEPYFDVNKWLTTNNISL